MKKLSLLLTACLITICVANAQITVPPYNFETAEDYTRCNDAILECCNWLIYTPIEQAAPYLDNVIKFIYEWSMGSPDVMILIDSYFMPYIESITPLLAWHMAGASKYQLERGIYARSVEEIRESTLAGVNAVLDYYETNKAFFVTEKGLEKMLKIRRKGQMEKYLAKRIKVGIDEGEST